MTIETEGSEDGTSDVVSTSLFDALLVYAEPLATSAHVVVVGDAESTIAERLLDLGARGVHIFDPDPARAANAGRKAPTGVTVRALVDELAVRDGAFDLAVVPDLSDLHDPREVVARLQRAVSTNGAVLAMGRAKLESDPSTGPSSSPLALDLGPPMLGYMELYELFAEKFEDVSLAGVLPFRGAVFAALGSDGEAPQVSVDTRLVTGDPPRAFVVVASRSSRPVTLDPYAIVQLPEQWGIRREDTRSLEVALAEAQLKGELLASQLTEARERIGVADTRTLEGAAQLERAATERDAALTRAMELETVLSATQQAMARLEGRLAEAERELAERDERLVERQATELESVVDATQQAMAHLEGRLAEAERALAERDERLSVLLSELESYRAAGAKTIVSEVIDVGAIVDRAERAERALETALEELATREEEAATQVDVDLSDISKLMERAERAESALALHVADLAHVVEAHAAEMASYEDQLRERAHVIAELEKELVRREQLVKELVTSLEESREGNGDGISFESAEPLVLPPPRRDPALDAELVRLRHKLDELALEVARCEGELLARAWRITELENELARLDDAARARELEVRDEDVNVNGETKRELARVQDELDALRQALSQEHAARVAAESGEELARARAELARQATLLEQMRARVEGV